MNILTFDTATSLEIAILASENGVFTEAERSSAHATSLFRKIGSLLDKASVSMANVEAIGVGIGPGSFTGLRIAVSSARMLAQINGIPIAGIMTHDIFAASMCLEAPEGSFLLPAFDAKKKRVFGALYRVREGNPRTIIPPGDYDLRFLLNGYTEDTPLITTGDGIEKYRCLLSGFVPGHIHRDSISINGEKISDIVRQKLKETPHTYNDVVPFYARKSDAEEQRAKTL